MTRRDVISQTARGVYVRWSIHKNFWEKLIKKDRSSRRIQYNFEFVRQELWWERLKLVFALL